MKEKDIIEKLKEKFGIQELNEMQKKMLQKSSESKNIILLSPTGSGKTIAFILPLLKLLKPNCNYIQCVIIAPSRELVTQIAKVFKNLVSDFRVLSLYGGRKVEDELNSLKVVPDVVVATPGRLLDHSQRHNLELLQVRILVLDEFDKSLELGFEEEMKKLIKRMKNVDRYILTSATISDSLPDFLKLDSYQTLDFSSGNEELKQRMKVHKVNADNKDKLESLLILLHNLGKGNPIEKTIIFVNHRESAKRIYDFLKRKGVGAILYHGALDQGDREKSLSLFNSGSRPILVATDLASRGLDIEDVKHVIHYHLPLTKEVFTHRNGRTARIKEEGDAYLLIGPDEELKDYISFDDEIKTDSSIKSTLKGEFETLYINAGKREKLSKGDILGFLLKEGKIEMPEVGKIEVFDHFSLANINESVVKKLLKNIEGKKIKGEKRKITVIKDN